MTNGATNSTPTQTINLTDGRRVASYIVTRGSSVVTVIEDGESRRQGREGAEEDIRGLLACGWRVAP